MYKRTPKKVNVLEPLLTEQEVIEKIKTSPEGYITVRFDDGANFGDKDNNIMRTAILQVFLDKGELHCRSWSKDKIRVHTGGKGHYKECEVIW